jgi:hypothetical protein
MSKMPLEFFFWLTDIYKLQNTSACI